MGARARAGSGRRGSALGRSLPRQPAVGPVPRSAQQRQRRAVACVAGEVRGADLLVVAIRGVELAAGAVHGVELLAVAARGAELHTDAQPTWAARARATMGVG